MNESLKRLRDAVTGRAGDREVEVAPDGTVREVGVEPAGPPPEIQPKPTKLSERTFGLS